jgi:hypothetical protein
MKMIGKIHTELEAIKERESKAGAMIEEAVLNLRRVHNKKTKRDMKEQKLRKSFILKFRSWTRVNQTTGRDWKNKEKEARTG